MATEFETWLEEATKQMDYREYASFLRDIISAAEDLLEEAEEEMT